MSDDIYEYGPAMRQLTAKQRLYVFAMLTEPFGNPTQWARTAGYSDSSSAAKVAGFHLAHNPKITSAVNEVAQRHLTTLGPVLGLAVMMKVARDPGHPKQLRAAEMLANRSGFHEKTEHTVSVHHSDHTGVAMVDRIRNLAAALGIDAAKLLGVNDAPRVIEGTMVDVSPAEE